MKNELEEGELASKPPGSPSEPQNIATEPLPSPK